MFCYPHTLNLIDTHYTYDKIHQLPQPVAIEKIKTVEIPNVSILYQGEFSPLSNMSKYKVDYDNEVYPTAEHAIVAMRAKIDNKMAVEAMVNFHSNPVKSKAKRWEESPTGNNTKLDIFLIFVY